MAEIVKCCSTTPRIKCRECLKYFCIHHGGFRKEGFKIFCNCPAGKEEKVWFCRKCLSPLEDEKPRVHRRCHTFITCEHCDKTHFVKNFDEKTGLFARQTQCPGCGKIQTSLC